MYRVLWGLIDSYWDALWLHHRAHGWSKLQSCVDYKIGPGSSLMPHSMSYTSPLMHERIVLPEILWTNIKRSDESWGCVHPNTGCNLLSVCLATAVNIRLHLCARIGVCNVYIHVCIAIMHLCVCEHTVHLCSSMYRNQTASAVFISIRYHYTVCSRLSWGTCTHTINIMTFLCSNFRHD